MWMDRVRVKSFLVFISLSWVGYRVAKLTSLLEKGRKAYFAILTLTSLLEKGRKAHFTILTLISLFQKGCKGLFCDFLTLYP
jgi:hypothetical protein